MGKSGAILSLKQTDGPGTNTLFIWGADEITREHGDLQLLRKGKIIHVCYPGTWASVGLIESYPAGMQKDDEHGVWVLKAPGAEET